MLFSVMLKFLHTVSLSIVQIPLKEEFKYLRLSWNRKENTIKDIPRDEPV